jgi:hypothetical protein
MVVAQGGPVVMSSKHVVPMLVALTLAAMLSGCGKKSTPTGLDSLDQAPPAAPTQITAQLDGSTDNGVIEWTPSASANVAGYQVYQYSPSPNRESAYVLAGETDAGTTHFSIPPAAEATTLYYHLCAISSTGVKSQWSPLLAVTAGPPQGGADDPTGIQEVLKPKP